MLPRYEISLKQSFEGVKPSSSPLLEEALRLGFVIRSIVPNAGQGSILPPLADTPWGSAVPPKRSLPRGHRFFYDCYREQEGRFLDWLISIYQGDTWFVSFTFQNYIYLDRSGRRLARWFSCVNQGFREVNAALLKSVSCIEWQERDVIHYHSLVFGKGLGRLSRKRWERRWQAEGGGYCRIYEADSSAALYLVKHQIKESPETALLLGGSWRDISLPSGLSRCCDMATNGSSSERSSPPGVQYLSGVDAALESKSQD